MPTSVTSSRHTATLSSAGKRHPAPRRQPDHGFSLVELIVVFAVATLIIGIAPFALSRLHEAAEYRHTVRLVP